ncbi:MAG: hypothetical protein HRU33_04550 [Rhodobacteraceae bacterium]|nr:hypothetical protein [Paracoccaceae bacterium]
MADFAKWAVAAEPSLGCAQGGLLDSYAANRTRSDQAAVAANPVALAILSLMEGRQHWSCTASDLRQTLRDRFPTLTKDSHSFPRSEARFGAALRRVQPLLRRQGLNIGFSRERKAGMRLIELTNN